MEKELEFYNGFVENEYNMLKDAHFQTSKRITSFFQYAILFFTAPMALLSVKDMDPRKMGLAFIVIGIIGLFVTIYLSRLRAEALMYARNINRIRKNIYTSLISKKTPSTIHNEKILLSQENKPALTDWGQFGFIVITLGILDSVYVTYGSYTRYTVSKLVSIGIGIVWFFVHLIAHSVSAAQSEQGTDYYKRRIGIDIDGVLNKHEEKFVDIYNKIPKDEKYKKDKKYKTAITKENITTLPVSKAGEISQKYEHMVFKTQNYWVDMPAMDGAKEALIDEIKNKLGYSIYYYTWRAWPIQQKIVEGKTVQFRKVSELIKTPLKMLRALKDKEFYSKHSIKPITKKWLKKEGFLPRRSNRVVFEDGNIDQPVRSLSVKYHNRYYFARKKRLRFFVEDSITNALHLSKTCEYVFLINHTYNQVIDEKTTPSSLPYNIIRVNDWKEIHEYIKVLG